jgi:hypothetical protein
MAEKVVSLALAYNALVPNGYVVELCLMLKVPELLRLTF